MRSVQYALAGVMVAALAGCGAGQGTGTEAAAGTGSGSGSTSAAVESDASAAAAGVPAGVAAQYATLDREIAAEGGQVTAGDWKIGYIVEPAEPWYETRDGKQVFRPVAPGETHHLEIVPREASTGRVVPNAPVTLEVVGADGKVVQSKTLEPYHAEFFHYANNFSVPTEGAYSLRATVGAPTFLRHGEEGEAPALAEGATVTFPNVKLEHEAAAVAGH